ncbi:hypothetical protein DFQ14_101233 [Halopolyspora algeriensis]|uniref:DUF3093 family protein n=2 Tax=Halopolyspora algeriensis TaxID=1500506 RepID=A0A368W2H8_9ACTN|nr:hypothetical protein DFQ14_101233 [Halopolyspora algeriensis]TQM47984.1 hypothetical protein FHU43_2936 [Halopolyspora algeriensis]
MTGSEEIDSEQTGSVLHVEPGASWWPVLWGPGFAVLGFAVEMVTRGPVHGIQWLLLAGALAVTAAAWVYGRRRWYSVRLTPASLTVGGESVPIARIAAVLEEEVPVGTRVLGGGWTTPKGTTAVPLRLHGDHQDGGSAVLAWARHPEQLTRALHRLVP